MTSYRLKGLLPKSPQIRYSALVEVFGRFFVHPPLVPVGYESRGRAVSPALFSSQDPLETSHLNETGLQRRVSWILARTF